MTGTTISSAERRMEMTKPEGRERMSRWEFGRPQTKLTKAALLPNSIPEYSITLSGYPHNCLGKIFTGQNAPARRADFSFLHLTEGALLGFLRAFPRAGVAQLVEHYLAKVAVESSSLFARSIFPFLRDRSFRKSFESSGRSSVGRALPCQGSCREFESLRPLHFRPRAIVGLAPFGVFCRG